MSHILLKKKEKLSFSYHLADHCNLRCKGCDNYSSIAPEKYPNEEEFLRDFRCIRALFNNMVSKILLLGGEPLLNPNIVFYIKKSREIFPEKEIEISIVTNGILLKKMTDDFWKQCALNGVVIEYTQYPIDIRYQDIRNKAKKYGAELTKYGHANEEIKKLEFLPFDPTGKQDVLWNFNNCFHANKCIQVSKGKIFTCNIRAYIEIFIEHYNSFFELSEKDYIDIKDASDPEEVLDFLAHPIPFCRYCLINRRNNQHVWRRSPCDSIYDWMFIKWDEDGKREMRKYKECVFISQEEKYVPDNVGDEEVIIITGYDDKECLRDILTKKQIEKDSGVIIFGSNQYIANTEETLIELGFSYIYYGEK